MSRHNPAIVQMIWTRPIDDQPMAGRLRVATAIRTALRDRARVAEYTLTPAIAGGARGVLGAAAAWCASLLRGPLLPLQCMLYADPAVVRRAVAAVDPAVSVIYLDGVRSFAVLRALRRRFPHAAIVVDLDDLMSRRMALLVEAREPLSPGYLTSRLPPVLVRFLTGTIGALIVRYECRTLPAVEAEITRLANTVVLLSSHDMQLMAGDGAARRETILPMVERIDRPVGLKPGPIRFIFAGSDTLTQNRLTIDYLVDLWRRARLTAPLVIFGRQAREVALPPNVTAPGYIDDIADAYDGHSVLLTPSFLRGGIKTKVIEAFAYGTAVIGSQATFEAMPLDDYPLVCDDEAALIAMLRDPEAYRALFDEAAAIGVAYVRRSHSPDRFEQRWREVMGLEAAAATAGAAA